MMRRHDRQSQQENQCSNSRIAMMHRRQSVRTTLCSVLVLCLASVWSQPTAPVSPTIPAAPLAAPASLPAAPTAANANCFATLGAINSDMETELIRIRNGASPDAEYVYTLCANTIFDATSTVLEPLLNNAMFICGTDGNRLNRCVILGGTVQVSILDSLVDGYPLQEVTFMGVTFSGFEANAQGIGTSIAALASSVTTATFIDCVWQDFTSDFVVQQNATESFLGPMTVQVERSTVMSGQTGAVFDNDGGLLRLSDLAVSGVMAASLVATANNGASFLERSTVTSSDMNTVTFTTAGGSQTVIDSSVSQMTRLQDGFFVEDAGSTLLLESVTIEENQGQTIPWNAVSVRTNAIASIAESTISDNTNLEYGVVAFDATVTIQDSFISRNSGTATDETSAAIFAITDAIVNLERVEFTENSGFSSIAIAIIRSTINIDQSCFQGGSSDYVVFVASDAMFSATENFIDNLGSQQCQATGPRLFQEADGSGCFLGSSTCEGTCLVMAEETSCRAQDGPTRAPVTPTSSPTEAPSRQAETSPPVATVRPSTTAPTAAPMPEPTRAPTKAPTPRTRQPVAVRPTSPTRTPKGKGMKRPKTAAPTNRLRPTTSPAPTKLSKKQPKIDKPKPDKPPKGGKGDGGGDKKKSDKGMKKSGKGGKGGKGKGGGKGGNGGMVDDEGKGGKGKGGKGHGKGVYPDVDHARQPSQSPKSVPTRKPNHQIYSPAASNSTPTTPTRRPPVGAAAIIPGVNPNRTASTKTLGPPPTGVSALGLNSTATVSNSTVPMAAAAPITTSTTVISSTSPALPGNDTVPTPPSATITTVVTTTTSASAGHGNNSTATTTTTTTLVNITVDENGVDVRIQDAPVDTGANASTASTARSAQAQ